MRVVFVDDEQGVLDGLAQTMRRYRREWDLVFVQGGDAALIELEAAPTDILVTDVQMPGMAGDTLLFFAKKLFPGMARIVLTGEADGATAYQLARLAHTCLAKPCSATTIRATIDRTARALAHLADQPPYAILGGVEELGDAPALAVELDRIIKDPASSIEDMADIIERSPAVSAKMMQLVSSAFFGPPHPVLCVRDAVTHLGPEVVRRVVSSLCWGDPAGSLQETSPLLDAVRRCQLRSAVLARQIMQEVSPDLADEAYLAGLFHDIGILALVAAMRELPPDERTAPIDAPHAALGAGLLGLWGFPDSVVEAVAHHHAPGNAERPGFGVVGAVHVAQALVEDGPGCDLAYLADMGVASRLPAWRELARSLDGGTR
jgi:HD-like signal output (HDOD) protein